MLTPKPPRSDAQLLHSYFAKGGKVTACRDAKNYTHTDKGAVRSTKKSRARKY